MLLVLDILLVVELGCDDGWNLSGVPAEGWGDGCEANAWWADVRGMWMTVVWEER